MYTQELPVAQPADSEPAPFMEESEEVVFGGLGHNVDTSVEESNEPEQEPVEENSLNHSAKQHADSNRKWLLN